MGKVLTDAGIAQFRDQGYFFPVSILSAAEVSDLRGRLEAFEARQGHVIEGSQRNKAHLLFKWLDDLIRHPKILDAAEDLIGPDILCWNSIFWIKEAGANSFVSWHQDVTYWGLDRNDVISAWIALSPATEASGCMRVLPGSHDRDPLPHADRYHEDNMLTRGQEIAVEVDAAKTVAMPLEPGQMSLHNYRLAHASGPNRADDRRIGVSLHYMPTRTKQIVGAWDSAAVVRGEDRYRHFEPTPRPTRDLDPEVVPFHEKATNSLREILYRDTQAQRHTV